MIKYLIPHPNNSADFKSVQWVIAVLLFLLLMTLISCSKDDDGGGTLPPIGGGTTTPTCSRTGSINEGPFHISGSEERRDIEENEAGEALVIRFTVLDANTCNGVEGATVDIWHPNALGFYSGHSSSDPNIAASSNNNIAPTDMDRFCRGQQVCDDEGVCEFRTIYPGWFRPSPTQISVKVIENTNEILNTKMGFPIATTNDVYANSPYNTRLPDYDVEGTISKFTMTEENGVKVASFTISVTRL